MRSGIVIAQVGTSAYHETEYITADMCEGTKSNYAFEAVMRQVLERRETDSLDLILVATTGSSMGSVYKAFYPEYQGLLDGNLIEYDAKSRSDIIPSIGSETVRRIFENDLTVKINKHFENIIGYSVNISVTVAIIEYGINDRELRGNFNIIRGAVESVQQKKRDDEEWNIYFDISNGFRSFPLYIYTLINYLSRLGSSNTKSYLYYGMFEAKNKDGITPLVNLQVIDDLMQLINAVNEFRNCGSVIQIRKLLSTHDEWNIQIGDNTNETLSFAFELFDYGTNANNLAAIEKGIVLLSGMKSRIEEEENLNDAEKLLLMDISNDFSVRFNLVDSDCPYALLMVRLAQWYHVQGREGNAAIAVQESITTLLMERYADKAKAYLVRHEDFPESTDLKEIRTLFNYKWRQPIVRQLRKCLENNKEFREFGRVYDYIRAKIRNVAAHILLSEEGDEPEQYREMIKSMIDYMIREIEQSEENQICSVEQGSFDDLVDYMFSEDQEDLLKNMLGDIDREVAGTDSFAQSVDLLRRQIITMRKYGNAFYSFYRKKDDLTLLLSVWNTWMEDSGVLFKTETAYKKYFERNKSGKMGYERLINYMKSNIKNVVLILRSTAMKNS